MVSEKLGLLAIDGVWLVEHDIQYK